MKSSSVILLIFLCVCSMKAQRNYVLNGGLEEGNSDSCYVGPFSLNYCPIKYWYQHQGASPDYYKSCSHNPQYSIPYNTSGDQSDASIGSSYVGIGCFTTNEWAAEYLMTKLDAPLKPSNKYLFTMYVNRADVWLLASNLGFCLEHDSIPIDATTNIYTPTSSAFVFQTDTSIRDCKNWVKFQYTFSPTSEGLQHLVIGNFYGYRNVIDSVSLVSNCTSAITAVPYGITYYLIDDVSLYCLDCDTTNPCPIATPDAFTPNADGMNDVWQPLFSNDCMLDSTSYLLHIFDRWGNLIFSSNSFNEPWKGNNAPLGTYVFYLQYDEKGITRKKQGSIELLR